MSHSFTGTHNITFLTPSRKQNKKTTGKKACTLNSNVQAISISTSNTHRGSFVVLVNRIMSLETLYCHRLIRTGQHIQPNCAYSLQVPASFTALERQQMRQHNYWNTWLRLCKNSLCKLYRSRPHSVTMRGPVHDTTFCQILDARSTSSIRTAKWQNSLTLAWKN